MPPQPDPVLGTVLRRFREDRKRTQEEIGYEAGLTRGTYAKIELGQSAPAWSTVRRVLDSLEVSLSDLSKAVEREEG